MSVTTRGFVRFDVVRHVAMAAAIVAISGFLSEGRGEAVTPATSVSEESGPPYQTPVVQARAVVRDSAGITIVENRSSTWGAQSSWRVDPAPLLQIGDGSGGAESLLTGVVGLVVFEDGPLVVANRGYQLNPGPTGVSTGGARGRGDNTLRYFDLRGTFLKKSGGMGKGPHEFDRLGGLHRAGMEVWAAESWGGAIRIFDKTGTFIRSTRPDSNSATFAQVVGALASGSVIATSGVGRLPAPGKLQVDSTRVFRILPDGSNTEILSVAVGARMGQKTGLFAGQAYGSAGIMKTGPRGLYVAWTGDPQVRVFDESGKLLRIVRWDAERLRVTEADKGAYRDRLASAAETPPSRFQPELGDVAKSMIFPEYHRVINAMELDDEGNVWLQLPEGRPGNERTTLPSTWSVLDTTGTFVAKISLPAGFWPQSIGRDHVTGVWRDDDGVEHVRMYRLHKGRAG